MPQASNLCLAPIPKNVTLRQGLLDVSDKRYIKLESADPPSLLLAAKRTGLDWEITASPRVPKDQVGLTIRVDDSADIMAEGYKLTIRPEGAEIVASIPAGAFYGACTLAQIVRQCDGKLPCLSISDWPDFPERGVMLDIARDKVPTMETLYHLVDLLSEWKINQLQLYTEHTFAYLAHPVVWEKATPMTGEEIMVLDAYCKSRFVELVPNQNSFGHMERWLRHDQYRPMAEAPNGCDTVWGFRGPFSLCPIDKRSIPFLNGLYDELLPHFTSSLFNVGCDETVDLGCGRSKRICKERGTGRVYLDFLLEIYKLVKQHDRIMMFWGDIIIHHPELIAELPKDMVALEWGYEAKHPFAKNCAKFAESGIPFYVCPGTSSWNSLAGRTDNAVANITSAARNGLKQGAIGLLNTDWGDNGHWQPLSVSYLGFLFGAMSAWNARADSQENLTQSLSLHAFGDSTGKTGKAFCDLGNIYTIFEKRLHNSSVPWQMLFKKDTSAVIDGLQMGEFDKMARRLEEVESAVRGEKMTSADASIIREEIGLVIRLLKLSTDLGHARQSGSKTKDYSARLKEVKKEHAHVWLLRNRPGGLEDSLSKIGNI